MCEGGRPEGRRPEAVRIGSVPLGHLPVGQRRRQDELNLRLKWIGFIRQQEKNQINVVRAVPFAALLSPLCV